MFKFCRRGILKQQFLGRRAEDVRKQGFIFGEHLLKDADHLALEVGDGIDQIAAEA